MKLSKALYNVNQSYVGHETVFMPPNWKSKYPVEFTFIYVSNDLNSSDFSRYYKVCHQMNVVNPRLFTPGIIRYSSLFHPAFYMSVSRSDRNLSPNIKSFISEITPLDMSVEVSPELCVNTVHYYLQSMIFLTGVTLSAALVQNRWSHGTIESKLNRLWQAGKLAEKFGITELADLNICDFVYDQAANLVTQPLNVLVNLKLFFSRLLGKLSKSIPHKELIMKKALLTNSQKQRFGFVKQLSALLGNNLLSIIVYGSSTNSEKFADYDVIIVVKELSEGLKILGGKAPTYNGLELNISIFDEEDFLIYQLVSGDNLHDHSICLFGEAMVPQKPYGDLLARNYSFGFIRLRQLLGMAAHIDDIASDTDDKSNLLAYFTKIPLNVSKGIQGSYGGITNNEELRNWFHNEINFDVDDHISGSKNGKQVEAISAAACATLEVLKYYDEKLNICVGRNSKKTITING